jgi:hypothetical protein
MAQWRIDNQEYLEHNKTIFEVVNLADEDGNIINSFAAASNIVISAGDLTGYSAINKFGRNPNIGGAPETIWMYGGRYVYLTSPSTVYAHSADTDDSVSGTGARTVTIQGLDGNYESIEETVTVRSGVATTAQFLRVFRAFVVTSGSTGTNEGNIIISTGAAGTGTVLADIGTIGTGTTYGLGQTQLALYTIPAGKTGYLTAWNIGVGSYNDAVTVTLLSREFNSAFRTRDIMDVPGGSHVRNYSVPIKLPAKTDVEIIGIASTGTNISSSFDIILVDNT